LFKIFYSEYKPSLLRISTEKSKQKQGRNKNKMKRVICSSSRVAEADLWWFEAFFFYFTFLLFLLINIKSKLDTEQYLLPKAVVYIEIYV